MAGAVNRRRFVSQVLAGVGTVATTACLDGPEPTETRRLELIRKTRCRDDPAASPLRDDSAWRAPYHDAANTSHNSVSGVTDEPSVQWKYGDGISPTYPAVVDDVVYVGGRSDATALAVDGASGDELWRRDLDGGRVSAPVVTDDAVFHVVGEAPLSDRSGCVLYRLDRVTGEVDWRHETALSGSPVPVVGESHVYYSAGVSGDDGSEGRFYAVDRVTGEEVWHAGGEGVVFDQIGAAATEETVYVPGRGRSGRDEIWAFDARDGSMVWQGGDSGAISSAPLAVSDGVLHANDRGYCADGGTEAFRLQIHGDVGTFVGALAVTDTSVFVRTTSGSGYPPDTVFRLDRASGATADYGFEDAEEIAVTDDALYVSEGYEPVTVHAVDPASTERLWSTEIDGAIVGLAATRERLTVATDNGLVRLA